MKIVTIGMTNLPSHFKMGVDHVREYKYIRLALGLHPLLANQHKAEYELFESCLDKTSYVGEVGLDFSKEGFDTKDIQLKSFEFALSKLAGKNKILSIHSRKAEVEVLNFLIKFDVHNVIFHWYSGGLNTLKEIIGRQFYFSINSSMIKSENGKKIISQIPKELILTETDSPFIENSNIIPILKYLSELWNVSEFEVEKTIDENFKHLLMKIR